MAFDFLFHWVLIAARTRRTALEFGSEIIWLLSFHLILEWEGIKEVFEINPIIIIFI